MSVFKGWHICYKMYFVKYRTTPTKVFLLSKNLEEIWQPKKGITKQAGQRGFFANRLKAFVAFG